MIVAARGRERSGAESFFGVAELRHAGTDANVFQPVELVAAARKIFRRLNIVDELRAEQRSHERRARNFRFPRLTDGLLIARGGSACGFRRSKEILEVRRRLK